MSGTVPIEIPTVATGRYRVEDGLLTVTYRGRSETTQLRDERRILVVQG